jgi:hypothetical protein
VADAMQKNLDRWMAAGAIARPSAFSCVRFRVRGPRGRKRPHRGPSGESLHGPQRERTPVARRGNPRNSLSSRRLFSAGARGRPHAEYARWDSLLGSNYSPERTSSSDSFWHKSGKRNCAAGDRVRLYPREFVPACGRARDSALHPDGAVLWILSSLRGLRCSGQSRASDSGWANPRRLERDAP